jgi:hypothetical protein
MPTAHRVRGRPIPALGHNRVMAAAFIPRDKKMALMIGSGTIFEDQGEENFHEVHFHNTGCVPAFGSTHHVRGCGTGLRKKGRAKKIKQEKGCACAG